MNFQASTSKDCINNRNANCELPFPLSRLSFFLNEYGLSNIQMGDIKLGRFLDNDQHTQMKLLHFVHCAVVMSHTD
jgi:hypothetical protein